MDLIKNPDASSGRRFVLSMATLPVVLAAAKLGVPENVQLGLLAFVSSAIAAAHWKEGVVAKAEAAGQAGADSIQTVADAVAELKAGIEAERAARSTNATPVPA